MIVVDTTALVATFVKESDRPAFKNRIAADDDPPYFRSDLI